MLSIFGSKEFSCFICGNTDPTGGKRSIHGDVCSMCASKLMEKGIKPKETKHFTAEQAIALCDSYKNPIELAEMFVVNNPPIAFKANEKCYYVGPACGGKIKTVTTGYVGASKGFSFRVMKGVSYHTGGSKGQAVREQVLETSAPGTFVITGNRFILQTSQYGFEVAGDKIQSVEMRPDGFGIYVKNKMHIVLTSDVTKIATIMQVLTAATEEAERQKLLEPPAEKPKRTRTKKTVEQEAAETVSGADEIRKYKLLMDEGIITEEQFEKKKNEILGN